MVAVGVSVGVSVSVAVGVVVGVVVAVGVVVGVGVGVAVGVAVVVVVVVDTVEMMRRLENALRPNTGTLTLDCIKANDFLIKEVLPNLDADKRSNLFDICDVFSSLHDHIKMADILVMLNRLSELEGLMESIGEHYSDQDMSHEQFRINAMTHVDEIKRDLYDAGG